MSSMELTARKREILRRVVEEYVATGQPVGSKVLVERPGLAVSSSTVRSELSELEALGLLTHPHTSAGRVPTENGYRIYTEELVVAIEGRPGPFSVDLRTMRNELEEALRRTTEALSDATHLLAVVSAPSFEAAAVRHVEVLQLHPRVVIIVVITASGSVSKRVFESEEPIDAGLVEWAASYLDETVVGKRPSPTVVRRAFEDPALTTRERRFLETVRPAFDELVAEGLVDVDQVAVAPADLQPLDDAAALEIFDDAEHRPLGDADPGGDVAQPGVGIHGDADEHVAVVAEEAPWRPRALTNRIVSATDTFAALARHCCTAP